jgi:hypothetical protein
VAVLWILIGFNANPDPAFWVNADPDPALDPGRIYGFDGKKTDNDKNHFFYQEIAIYFSLRPYKGRLSYRSTTSNSKHKISSSFSISVGKLCPPRIGSGCPLPMQPT